MTSSPLVPAPCWKCLTTIFSPKPPSRGSAQPRCSGPGSPSAGLSGECSFQSIVPSPNVSSSFLPLVSPAWCGGSRTGSLASPSRHPHLPHGESQSWASCPPCLSTQGFPEAPGRLPPPLRPALLTQVSRSAISLYGPDPKPRPVTSRGGGRRGRAFSGLRARLSPGPCRGHSPRRRPGWSGPPFGVDLAGVQPALPLAWPGGSFPSAGQGLPSTQCSGAGHTLTPAAPSWGARARCGLRGHPTF